MGSKAAVLTAALFCCFLGVLAGIQWEDGQQLQEPAPVQNILDSL